MDIADLIATLVLLVLCWYFCTLLVSSSLSQGKHSKVNVKRKKKSKSSSSSDESNDKGIFSCLKKIQRAASTLFSYLKSHPKLIIGSLLSLSLFAVGKLSYETASASVEVVEIIDIPILQLGDIDILGVQQIEKDPLRWDESFFRTITSVVSVSSGLRGGQPVITKTKSDEECKNFPACKPNIDHIDVTEPSRSTTIQDALFDSFPLAEYTSEINALLQFIAYGDEACTCHDKSDDTSTCNPGLVCILDEEAMLTHHSNYASENFLVLDRFKVCNAGALGGGNHAGVYLKLVDTDTICDDDSGTECKVGRMTKMCSGSKDRDGYDHEKVVAAFNLDKCGSKCVHRIEELLAAFKDKIPKLDYKTATTTEFVEYSDNNGGLSPHLGLFFQQNEDGGYGKLGVEKAVILNFAESTVQTHWKGDIGPNIEQNSAVHEGLHYQAGNNFIKERHGNAIAMWGKVEVVLSEKGILFYPLADMVVTFETCSVSWCPETETHGVNLANVKIEVAKTLGSNTDTGEVVAELEEQFTITGLSAVTGHLTLNDIDGWVGAVEHRMNENKPPKKQVFATRVCYDRLLDKDGSYEKKLFTDPIVIKGHGLGESGYNTDLIECTERIGSRNNIEERLLSSKVTRGDRKNAKKSIVIVLIEVCKECFRSTSDCECTDSIEAMMERHHFVHFATYGSVKHYYHRNEDCQTTLAYVHGVFSTALHSDKHYLPPPSRETMITRVNKGDDFDYVQGCLRKFRHPSEPFLANQKASESLKVASTHKKYLERRWHTISLIGTMYAKDFLLINNESINSLAPEYGLKGGAVSNLLRYDEKKDYNVGYKIANYFTRRYEKEKQSGEELDDRKVIKKFTKAAFRKEIQDDKRSMRDMSKLINNIKHLQPGIKTKLEELRASTQQGEQNKRASTAKNEAQEQRKRRREAMKET